MLERLFIVGMIGTLSTESVPSCIMASIIACSVHTFGVDYGMAKNLLGC